MREKGTRTLLRYRNIMFRRKRPPPQQPDRVPSASGGLPRAQESRISDHFERNLRTALQDLSYEIRPNMLLEDCLALTLAGPGSKGTLERHASKTFDYVIVARRSSLPVLAVVLSTKSYGRDRRAAPVVEKDNDTGKLIVTVVHVNPHVTNTAEAIQQMILPHL